MGNAIVALSADNPLGVSVCKMLLQTGWNVFMFTSTAVDEIGETLSEDYLDHYNQIFIDPRSIDSISKAAEVIKGKTDQIDMFVYCTADRTNNTESDTDFESMTREYDIGALAPIRLIEVLLPLMEKGQKRLCFITHPIEKLSKDYQSSNIGSSMAAISLHMAVKIMFNDIGKDGYTFRMFTPSAKSEETASKACDYFLQDQENENDVVIKDEYGKKHSFLE